MGLPAYSSVSRLLQIRYRQAAGVLPTLIADRSGDTPQVPR